MDNPKEENKTSKVNQVSEIREEKISISYFKIFLAVLIANTISGILEASPITGSLLGELVKYIYKACGI